MAPGRTANVNFLLVFTGQSGPTIQKLTIKSQVFRAGATPRGGTGATPRAGTGATPRGGAGATPRGGAGATPLRGREGAMAPPTVAGRRIMILILT